MIAQEQALVPSEEAGGGEGTYKKFFRGIGKGLGIVGENLCAMARHTGAFFKRAADTAHDDVRAQLVELPFFALTQLFPKEPADRIEEPMELAEGPQGRPVVLIHGMGGSAGNWELARNLLKVRGRKNIFRFDYRGHDSMRSVVPEFENYLRAIIDRCSEDMEIDILAHSMGGLVARAALRNSDIRDRVNHMVTIGTPHQGSHLARLGGFNWSKEIRPGSSFMTMLNADDYREVEKQELRITAFWTERDVLVIPPSAAALPGAENIGMHEATHISWLVRPRQVHQVLEALDSVPTGSKTSEESGSAD
jgi:pimeloyl-ACP methyl ester carboxylesterase